MTGAPVQVGDHVFYWVNYRHMGYVGGWQQRPCWGVVKKVNRKTIHILRDQSETLEIVPTERVLGGCSRVIR